MTEMAVLNNVMATSAKKRKTGLLSRCLSAVNKSTAKALLKYIAAPLALYLIAQGVAQADDLAAAGKQDVQDTFGQNSTMMYYFMIAEVFLVFMLYLRNHNPATFVLIPVKALTARFNRALSDSLTAYQREHRAVIIVAPAVVGGAEDITADIQQAVAARMAEGT